MVHCVVLFVAIPYNVQVSNNRGKENPFNRKNVQQNEACFNGTQRGEKCCFSKVHHFSHSRKDTMTALIFCSEMGGN